MGQRATAVMLWYVLPNRMLALARSQHPSIGKLARRLRGPQARMEQLSRGNPRRWRSKARHGRSGRGAAHCREAPLSGVRGGTQVHEVMPISVACHLRPCIPCMWSESSGEHVSAAGLMVALDTCTPTGGLHRPSRSVNLFVETIHLNRRLASSMTS